MAASVAGIPLNPAGNPQIGRFPYSQTHAPGVSEYTYSIDLAAAGLDNEGTLELAAQAEVSLLSGAGGVIGSEGAWAQGEPFDLLLVQAGKGGKGEGGGWAMHFAVDMNKLRGLLLWNKLGSQFEVQHSIVGPNGVITGDVTYLPARYGNGFEPLPRTGDHNNPDNFIDFPGLHLGQKGCVEFWYFPDWSDWQVGHIIEVLYYGVPGSVYNTHLSGQYNDWQGLLNLGAGSSGVDGVSQCLIPSSTPGWSTSAPFHLAMTWDGTLPVVSDRLKIFLDGQPVGSLNGLTGDPRFVNWNASSVLRLGTRLVSGDWNRHNWEGDHAVFDNLKVWNYPKTDFSDRLHE